MLARGAGEAGRSKGVSRRRSPGVVAALFALSLACSREGSSTVPPIEAGSLDAGRPDAAVAHVAEPQDSRPPSGQARRRTVIDIEKDDTLRPHAALLRERFGDAAKAPLALQEVDLAGGRRGLVVSTPDLEAHLVIVLDNGRVAFAKARPTAGMPPPVHLLALSPRPDGGAVLFAYVPSVRAIAARMWTSDGGAFAEILLMTVDACDALTASYEEGAGSTVRAAAKGGVRAQLLREDGTLAWGKDGVELPAGF